MELTNVALNAVVIAIATAWVTWHAKGRFAEIDERFAEIDERFAQVNERFAEVNERLTELRADMRKGFEDAGSRFDRLEKRQDRLEDRFETRITTLEGNMGERMNGLQSSVDVMRSDLTHFIRGMPPRAGNA